MSDRLSRLVATARVWVSSRKDMETRHNQALAECRQLKREVRELRLRHTQSKADHAAADDAHNDVAIELANARRMIEDLESQLDLARNHMDFLATYTTSQAAMIDKRIAQDVAASVAASRGVEPRGELNGPI